MALSVPLLLAAASPALAQSYPARNITMIVPFPAGGPSDTVARIMAEGMSRHLGHNVIIENVGGADVKQGVDGIGGTSYMACLLFNKMFGLKPTLVIYRDAECAGRQGSRRAR